MLSYCLKCGIKIKLENLRIAKTSKGKIILLLKWTVCDRKKLRFIKKQEASGLLSKLGLKKTIK